MRRERGFGYVDVAIAFAAVGVAVAIVWGVVHLVQGYGADKYDAGVTAEKGRWTTRENAELAKKNAEILALEQRVRDLEAKSATDVAELELKHQGELKEKEDEKNKALADARAGRAYGLRWAAKCGPAGSQGPGLNAAATAGAGAGASPGAGVCELPADTRDNLIRLASRADKVALERNEAVAIAVKDREVCDGRSE